LRPGQLNVNIILISRHISLKSY